MHKKPAVLLGAALLAVLVVVGGLALYGEVADIGRASGRWPERTSSHVSEPSSSYAIGVVSRFAPALTYETYQPLIDYLNRATPHHFRLRLGRSYEETVEQLANEEVIAAFLGSYIFVQVREELPIQPLLRPLNPAGEPFTRSTLIARAGGPVKTVADLEGRSLALPSPASFSGNWLTRMALREHGLSVDDLAEVQFLRLPPHRGVSGAVGPLRCGSRARERGTRVPRQGDRGAVLSPVLLRSSAGRAPDADPAARRGPRAALLEMPTFFPEGLQRRFANGFVEAKNEDYDLLEAWVDQMDEEHG